MPDVAANKVSNLLERAGEASEFLMRLANLVGGERSVRELEDTLGIRQPGLSQQIAELRDAGLIAGRKESKSVFYRLADDHVKAIVSLLYSMSCEQVPEIATVKGTKHD